MQYTHLFESSLSIIEIQKVVGSVIGNVEIEVAITVDVGADHSEPFSIFAKSTRPSGVDEAPFAVSKEEEMRYGSE